MNFCCFLCLLIVVVSIFWFQSDISRVIHEKLRVLKVIAIVAVAFLLYFKPRTALQFKENYDEWSSPATKENRPSFAG